MRKWKRIIREKTLCLIEKEKTNLTKRKILEDVNLITKPPDKIESVKDKRKKMKKGDEDNYSPCMNTLAGLESQAAGSHENCVLELSGG